METAAGTPGLNALAERFDKEEEVRSAVEETWSRVDDFVLMAASTKDTALRRALWDKTYDEYVKLAGFVGNQ